MSGPTDQYTNRLQVDDYRQISRQIDIFLDRHISRLQDKIVDRQISRQTDRFVDIQLYQQTNRQICRHTAILADKQIDQQTNNQIKRHSLELEHEEKNKPCHGSKFLPFLPDDPKYTADLSYLKYQAIRFINPLQIGKVLFFFKLQKKYDIFCF